MTRRRFAFWLGFGLFNLAELLQAEGLDALAAATMDSAEPTPSNAKPETPEHWTAAEDDTWRWFERENRINGRWTLTGTTAPINKETGARNPGDGLYLDDELLPANMRPSDQESLAEAAAESIEEPVTHPRHLPTAKRRTRHGRPPSKWLRSLQADEIRIWLKTIKVPEAGVSGMTYWTHLTRDHSFDPEKIKGLTTSQQAKLHAAAHYGY